MEKIGTQNGIESARRRENQFHPKDPDTGSMLTAWDTRSHTLQLLVGNVNALIDLTARQTETLNLLSSRVAVLESRPAVPFPGSS